MSLTLHIEYSEEDNLANVSRVMMDLDPDNNIIVLRFSYSLDINDFIRLKEDFKLFSENEKNKKEKKEGYEERDLN